MAVPQPHGGGMTSVFALEGEYPEEAHAVGRNAEMLLDNLVAEVGQAVGNQVNDAVVAIGTCVSVASKETDQLNAGDLLNAAKSLERAEDFVASQ